MKRLLLTLCLLAGAVQAEDSTYCLGSIFDDDQTSFTSDHVGREVIHLSVFKDARDLYWVVVGATVQPEHFEEKGDAMLWAVDHFAPRRIHWVNLVDVVSDEDEDSAE